MTRSKLKVGIIGAGPAGMAAAVRALQSGAEVTVLDDNAGPGGQIWRGGTENQLFRRWQKSRIDFRPLTAAIDEHQQYDRLILAVGARELFLPFPGWTLPGVFGVGGLQALVKSGLPIVGRKVVLAGSGPLLLAVAANLKRAGAQVLLIAEQAESRSIQAFAAVLWRFPLKLAQAAALRAELIRVPYRFGTYVESAVGEGGLEQVHVRSDSTRESIACDYAGVGYGLVPNVELGALLGCQLSGGAFAVNERMQTSVPHVFAAGECTGIGGVEKAVIEGELAACAACGIETAILPLQRKRRSAMVFADALTRAFRLRNELRQLPQADTIVCRCEDVRYSTLQNQTSMRGAKLHTRCGMGPCQARVCGPATNFLFGWQAELPRQPLFPQTISRLLQ